MSKFINTEYNTTIDSLMEGLKDRLKNPYYTFIDKHANIVEYYNRNLEKSTLDEGTKHQYSILGQQSPTRYNLIHDAHLYGIERIAINWNLNDFGLEADPIEGDAIVLPNTFIPYQDDFFIIKHTDKKILFKVLEVSIDTLENGANLYKIRYKLDRLDDIDIDNLVVEEYRMLNYNEGTGCKCVVRETTYELAEKLDNYIVALKKYYKSLFYNNKVQTFTFILGPNEINYFYDPYMIEFIIRNNILAGDSEYTYVSHQIPVTNTFSIDYDRSFFRALELRDKNKVPNRNNAMGFTIEDPNSPMSSRYEDYFRVEYNYEENFLNYIITPITPELVQAIKENTYYAPDDPKNIYNIIVSYFNGEDFKPEMIKILDTINYKRSMHMFYLIPIVIYVIEYYLRKLLS